MTAKSSWKFLPLAALFAIGLFVFSPGNGVPPTAQAAVDTLEAPETVADNQTIEVVVEAEVDTGDVVIGATGGNDTTFTDVACTPSCSNDIEGENTDEVTVDSSGVSGAAGSLLTITLQLLVECDAGDTITISAAQDDEEPTEVDVECVDLNVTIIKAATGAAATDEFEFSVTASGSHECEGTQTLVGASDEVGLACDEGVEYTITETEMPAGWALTQITCTDVGIADADIEITVADASVVVAIDTGDSIECTFTNSKNLTPTAGTATTVTASAAPTSVGCSGSSFVTIVVKGAGGANVADGTAVNITTNIGTVSPAQATTSGGGVLTIFTGPANSGGTATITATSGSITGSTQVAVNCSQAQATTAPPPPATGGSVVVPPSTGDAGLLQDGSGWIAYAGAALLAGGLLGGFALIRRRA
jgi:hypothetical protein